MIPMINTAAEAKLVVESSKFPPLGVRGQGSPFTAFAHGLSIPEYLRKANDSIITMVQIETTKGVDNAEEIAAVPGVGEELS
jgi:4-hydroxy-2-oxoheptanedioate aldolase